MQEELQAFVAPFRRHEKDNGSPEVQIAILTFEITGLQAHLKEHSSDVDAKRSLLKKVAKRRKYLKYLKENELERYAVITKKLKIKA
ncbi:MAG: 30S ribosomal protein S15 [Candidatus Peribacteria bacterium]|nr:MAG: 30S ribosomal protein S15 [Candidatus Peribacteria bacterium]